MSTVVSRCYLAATRSAAGVSHHVMTMLTAVQLRSSLSETSCGRAVRTRQRTWLRAG